MFSHLGLSLLDQSEESDPMTSVDPPSVILAQIFFVAFLILGVVLLINMLIALLSNTYQKTEVRTWLIVLKLTNIHYLFAVGNKINKDILLLSFTFMNQPSLLLLHPQNSKELLSQRGALRANYYISILPQWNRCLKSNYVVCKPKLSRIESL